jgi:hypothetical protein
MPTIQLRDLPESLYLAIQRSAKEARRSMTKEAIFLIEKALNNQASIANSETPKMRALAELKKMAQSNLPKLSLSEINSMIEKDRQQ